MAKKYVMSIPNKYLIENCVEIDSKGYGFLEADEKEDKNLVWIEFYKPKPELESAAAEEDEDGQ